MKMQRELSDRLAREIIFPNSDVAKMLGLELSREFKLFDLFRRPELDVLKVVDALGMNKTDMKIVSALETIETEIKYEGYIKRQKVEIQKIRKNESEAIPTNLNYDVIEGLSSELKQKLVHFRPKSLDRASRIPGMTPAALSILLVHAKRASAE
jgi:tRNA uridine 5-carboxymethylaminomethyl modification enzyme